MPTSETGPLSGEGARRAGPFQFGLASLLLLVTISAVTLSFWKSLGPGPVVFIIGFSALMLLVLRMMSHTPPDSLVVIDMGSDADAHACRSFLRAHGVAAEVVSEQAFQAFQLLHRSPQIVVSAEQADRARELLAELAEEVHRTEDDAG